MQWIEVPDAFDAVACFGQLDGTGGLGLELLSRLQLGEQLIGDATGSQHG